MLSRSTLVSLHLLCSSYQSYNVQVEDTTSNGSIDLVIETPTHTFLIKHKILARDDNGKVDRAPLFEKGAQEALKQIDQEKYAAKFSIKHGKVITKVGVCFDAQTRSVGWIEVL